MQQEATAGSITSRGTYGSYRNNKKLSQGVKHSRWKRVVITLTIDPSTSRYVSINIVTCKEAENTCQK